MIASLANSSKRESMSSTPAENVEVVRSGSSSSDSAATATTAIEDHGEHEPTSSNIPSTCFGAGEDFDFWAEECGTRGVRAGRADREDAFKVFLVGFAAGWDSMESPPNSLKMLSKSRSMSGCPRFQTILDVTSKGSKKTSPRL